MGTFLSFNVFLYDLVTFLDDPADMIDSLCLSLQTMTGDMLPWFYLNYMKANSEEFIFILFGGDNNSMFTTDPLKVVKLLRVQTDFQLKCSMCD